MKKRTLMIICLLSLLFAAPIAAQTKSITMRAFFPEPIGTYDRILLREVNIDPMTATDCDVGALYARTRLVLPEIQTIYACYDNDNYFPEPGSWKIIRGVWSYQPRDGESVGTIDRIYPTANSSNLRFNITPTSALTEPEFRLTMDNDGGILSVGSLIADGQQYTQLPLSEFPGITYGSGTRLLWYPAKSAFRAGHLSETVPDYWNDAEIGNFSAAMGRNQRASADYAMILSGSGNIIDALGTASTIAGGTDNQIRSVSADYTGAYGIIGGGQANIIMGSDNRDAKFSFIGGGQANEVRSRWGVVIGGKSNKKLGNIYYADYSVIGGGENNMIGNSAAPTEEDNHPNIVVGGKDNVVDIRNNQASGSIGGGMYNKVLVAPLYPATRFSHSLILGGGSFATTDGNTIDGDSNIIAGGENNAIGNSGDTFDHHSSFIGGGKDNVVEAYESCLFGGEGGIIDGDTSGSGVIIGGKNNRLNITTSSLTPPFIGGGEGNMASFRASICGGNNNQCDMNNGFIGGGQNNGCWVMGGSGNAGASGNVGVSGGKNMQGGAQYLWGHSDAPFSIVPAVNAFIIYDNNDIRDDDNDGDNELDGEPNDDDKYVKVGVQTLTPQERLDVNGGIIVRGFIMPDATFQGTYLGNVPTGVAGVQLRLDTTGEFALDLAEHFRSDERLSPGSVVIINEATGKVSESISPYSRNVVGIVSTSPAMVFENSRIIINPKGDETPSVNQGTTSRIALKGRVPVKVTLENGPIKPGDPLTSSSLAGHAMKSADPEKSWGTTIGKALEGFSGGPEGQSEGVITAFVTLY
ncbi:MAG: hypothetical protein AB1650_09655 [Candidatus Omnitrophota bacterium]